MDYAEVNKLFDEAGVSSDDLLGYCREKYLDNSDSEEYDRDTVLGVIKRIKEWKNKKKYLGEKEKNVERSRI